MFAILHEIKEKTEKNSVEIKIDNLKEVTVNVSEARVIANGHLFDKYDLNNFQYFNPEKVSGISTILKFETFEIEVAEDYKYVAGLVK